ncbi:RCC1/BLIP-II protein [Calocera viscosa TUFC12733]|uniref:RCC1/BLIP-II protein n=1 Tax=Calocera viscosa (strain TUFC12733) TaxID=1330018 RepID=A0A167IP12_CALVF|nr:RCC1/BLIP-II protein [Calocera viscosa TUFC12733]
MSDFPSASRLFLSTSEGRPTMHLFAAGSNAAGQLGIGSTDDAHQFTRCRFVASDGTSVNLPAEAEIRSLSAGANFTVLLVAGLESEQSELWASGSGSEGQLGPFWTGTTTFRKVDLGLTGTPLANYEPIIVSTSWETTIVVLRLNDEDADDAIISLGSNTHGKLGVGHLPASTSSPLTIPITNTLTANRLPNSLHILELASGLNHILAIVGYQDAQDRHLVRTVIGWGVARHGQLGSTLPDPRSPLPGCQPRPALFISSYDYYNEHQQPVLAALGQRHTVLLLPSGTLSICGSNDRQQLRGADRLTNVKDIGCTWNGTYAVLRSGNRELMCSNGSNDHGQLGRVQNAPAPPADRLPHEVLLPLDRCIFDLACGSEHVVVLCRHETDGAFEVWGWGWNEHGNLGMGHRNDVRIPSIIWPPHNFTPDELAAMQLERVWAGSGTTFILCRDA